MYIEPLNDARDCFCDLLVENTLVSYDAIGDKGRILIPTRATDKHPSAHGLNLTQGIGLARAGKVVVAPGLERLRGAVTVTVVNKTRCSIPFYCEIAGIEL